MRVVMQKCDNRKDHMAFYRFWNHEKASEKELVECAIEHCEEHIKDIEAGVLIQDTTDCKLEKHRNRIGDTTGLGVVGNDRNHPGFLCHPTIAVNLADQS